MSQVSASLPSTGGNTRVDQSTLSNYFPLKAEFADSNDSNSGRVFSQTGSPVVWFAVTEEKPKYAAVVFEDGASIVGEYDDEDPKNPKLTNASLTSEGSRQSASQKKTAAQIGFDVTEEVDSTEPWSGRKWKLYGKDSTSSDKPSVARKGVSWADSDAIESDPLPAIPTTVSQAPTLRAKTDDETTAIETTSKKTKFGSLAKGMDAFRKLRQRAKGSSSKS